MKALIVDDEYEYLSLLRLILQHNGYETVHFRSGEQAWEALQTACESGDPIQLVITDWMMPGMEGPQLIQNIRDGNFPSYTYIILMTARASRRDIVEGIQSGADDYLVKPFEPDEVLARLSIAERILNLEKMLLEQKEQLIIMASYDAVTGLLNRRKLSEIAPVEIVRAQRKNESVGMIMIDIDFFKSVNDRYGHSAGDAALKLIANSIISHLRPYDHAGRWGGEEFLLLLPGTSLDETVLIAERLRASLAETPLDLDGQAKINLSASFGVVSSSQFPELDFEKLVRLADNALYQAKHNGRNRVEIAHVDISGC